MSAKFFVPLVAAFFALSANPAHLQTLPGPDEKILFEAANFERVSNGLEALKWDATLAAAAKAHLREIVAHNSLSHQFSGEADLTARAHDAGAHFRMVAENIALADAVDELHIAWMNSPGHRGNILNPKFTSVGIAVQKRGDRYFAVQDFSIAVDELSKPEQEKKVGELLRSQGLKISPSAEEARRACDSAPANSGHHAMAVLHLETADLSQLSDDVVKAVKNGAYRTASVGACNSVESKGFFLFRIAILLY